MQQISTPIKPRTDMLTFYPVSLHHMTNLVNCLPFCLQNLFLTIFIKKIFIRSKYVTYLKYVSDKIVIRFLKKIFFSFDYYKFVYRFDSIITDDHSRVKLRMIDDDPCSDYVNANYIIVRFILYSLSFNLLIWQYFNVLKIL